jgi:hypothetical protein
MSDDRRDNSVTAFLMGFMLGALLAGGGSAAFLYAQLQRTRAEAEEARMMAAEAEAVARRQAEVARKAEMEARENERKAMLAVEKMLKDAKPKEEK